MRRNAVLVGAIVALAGVIAAMAPAAGTGRRTGRPDLPSQTAPWKAAWQRRTFGDGTWGGEVRREFAPQPGDIVAQEHWCSSGFANTDLDLQLKKHGIHQLIVIGGWGAFKWDAASSKFTPATTANMPPQGNDAKCGLGCHTIVKTRDYVFTDYGKR